MTIQKRTCRNRSTYFTATLRIKGHPSISRSFGSRPDAKEWLDDTKAKIKRGINLNQFETDRHTLSEAIKRYKENELPQRNSDHKKFKTHLEWWDKQIGDYYLTNITPAMLAECRDNLKNESNGRGKLKSNATVNRYISTLSTVLTIACNEWNWIEENPFKKVRKKKEDNSRTRFLSDDERKSLLKACKNSQSPYLYIVVMIALCTGARFSEILNLEWQSINFKRRTIIYMNTKNGDNRTVPISSNLYRILHKHSKIRRLDTSLLFPNKIGDKPTDLRDGWNLAVKKAKLTDFKFHDLRHTAASYLAMNGATLLELSHILGHKTLNMVKRYAHLTDQHTADLIEKMNKNMLINSKNH